MNKAMKARGLRVADDIRNTFKEFADRFDDEVAAIKTPRIAAICMDISCRKCPLLWSIDQTIYDCTTSGLGLYDKLITAVRGRDYKEARMLAEQIATLPTNPIYLEEEEADTSLPDTFAGMMEALFGGDNNGQT